MKRKRTSDGEKAEGGTGSPLSKVVEAQGKGSGGRGRGKGKGKGGGGGGLSRNGAGSASASSKSGPGKGVGKSKSGKRKGKKSSKAAKNRHSKSAWKFPWTGRRWTEDEQELLEKYLLEFPPEEFSSVLRYVKISAKIQKKCAREVALRIRWMRANGLPVDGVSSFVNAGGFIGADQGVMEGMGPGLPLQSPSSSSGGGGGGVGGSGVAGVGAGDRGGDQPPGAYASSYGSSFEEIKAYASARSGALMGENITFLGKIRKNLTEGRYDENLITMAKLRSNVAMLVGLFGSLPVQMPPLDVVLDTSTLSMERAMQQQQLRLRK